MTRTGLVAALAVVLAGCGGMKLEDFADGTPHLLLEEYFVGRTTAWGLFEDRFGRVRREFRVEITGRYDEGVLTLVEDFVYSDGEQEQRVWRITPQGDGRYEGRADDVVGTATGAARGNAVHWQYDLELPIGDRVWQVHFDDWMLLQDDAVMINRATVSKFGLTLGEVTLFFQKVDRADP
jgi:Protein of unknown function (DUF3833)